MSNGAGMTMALVCGPDTRFAAAAPVAGVNLVGSCEPERFIPLRAFHGDTDPLIPADGGQVVAQNYEVVAVQDRMQDLADLANCTGPVLETPFDDIEQRSWSGCDVGVEFVLTTVLGGGHTWPGSDLLGGLGQRRCPVDILLGPDSDLRIRTGLRPADPDRSSTSQRSRQSSVVSEGAIAPPTRVPGGTDPTAVTPGFQGWRCAVELNLVRIG